MKRDDKVDALTYMLQYIKSDNSNLVWCNDVVDIYNEINKEKKGTEEMNSLNVNDVMLSVNCGPAFKTAEGNFIEYYDDMWHETKNVIKNQNIFYSIPTPIEELKKGDFIRFNGLWVRITGLYFNTEKQKTMLVEKILEQEVAEVLINLEHYERLVSLVDFINGKDTKIVKEKLLPLLLNKSDNVDLIPLLIIMKE